MYPSKHSESGAGTIELIIVVLILAMLFLAINAMVEAEVEDDPAAETALAEAVQTSEAARKQWEEDMKASQQAAELDQAIPALSGGTPTPTAAPFLVSPLQDTNCRYGCQASLFDIADTLLAGEFYEPVGYDANSGFYQFVGPLTGQLCYVFDSFFDVHVEGVEVELESSPSNYLEQSLCPTPPATATATVDPDEGQSAQATETPTAASGATQCNDGIDNDGDSLIDLADRECRDANDNDESVP